LDRKFLKVPFTRQSVPAWTCPTCQKASLQIREDSFVKAERLHSRDHSHEAWEPEHIEYVYSCLLVCANEKCKEVVTCSGTGFVDMTPYEDETGNLSHDYGDYFRPKFFEPSLRLCQIPMECPETVCKPIQDSFAVFFAAPSAASNGIRSAMEALLTDLKIRRIQMVNGKRRFLNLHQRIDLLPGEFAHLKDMILAIKWLGNAGSHSGKEVTVDDVMDSYELMEFILNEIYASKVKVKALHKIAKKVNKKKGPIKRGFLKGI
jgi:hypothetical protein